MKKLQTSRSERSEESWDLQNQQDAEVLRRLRLLRVKASGASEYAAKSYGAPKTKSQVEDGLPDVDRDAFQKLVANGVPRGHLRCVLRSIPRTPARPISEIVKAMTERRLLNLPNRIVRFAEELEQVNSSPLLKDLIRTSDVNDFLICARRNTKYLDLIDETFRSAPDWESQFLE